MKILRFQIPNSQLVVAAIVLALFIAAYGTVIPTVIARHYLVKLEHELQATDRALARVAREAVIPAFTDPDISPVTRGAQISTAIEEVKNTKGALARLDHANRLTKIPGGDITDGYREAAVRHRQSQNLVRQSGQVLESYDQTLQYLRTYTAMQIELDEHLNRFNAIRSFDSLIGQGGSMRKASLAIRQHAKKLESMPIPRDFESLKTETVTTFTRAADGFGKLANGLDRGSDSDIYGAVGWLEAISQKNQTSDRELLVSLADSSPILRQLVELPEKAETALGR